MRSEVGPSVVGTVARTPIRVPSRAACMAIASSIFTTGVPTLRAATSRAGPSEEQAVKMTSAPAASAACARWVIRASLCDEIPCSRTTVARTSESTKCITSASGISSAMRSLIAGSTETNTKLVCRIAIFFGTLDHFLGYQPDVRELIKRGRHGLAPGSECQARNAGHRAPGRRVAERYPDMRDFTTPTALPGDVDG